MLGWQPAEGLPSHTAAVAGVPHGQREFWVISNPVTAAARRRADAWAVSTVSSGDFSFSHQTFEPQNPPTPQVATSLVGHAD